MTNDDMALVREYAQSNSEEAFTALVSRRINLVHSVALRQVHDPHLAEEITQAVFLILARKAKSLSPKTILSAWLCRTARYASADALKIQRRRQFREQEAHMQSILNESESDAWAQIAPHLDDALNCLGEKEHNAVVLRFFEGKEMKEVGAAMGIGEDAARMRVNRGVERLRTIFAKRGITLSAAMIAGAVSAYSIQAAPAALAKSVTAIAVGNGAAVSGSVFAIVKGASNLMAWAKVKTALVIGLGMLLSAATVATLSKWLQPSGNGLPSKVVGSADDTIAQGTSRSYPDATGTSRLQPVEEEIQFQAEGIVVYSIARGASDFYNDTKRFIVVRDGNVWKIRTINVKQEGTGFLAPYSDSIDLYYEMGFDGTNIFTLEQQDERKVLPTFSADVLRSGHYSLALGRVEEAVSPPCLDRNQLCSVWLAFCSAPYFAGLRSDKAVAGRFATRDFLTESIPRMQLPAKWKLADGYFIKNVSWFSDGAFEAHRRDGSVTIEKYAAPYDKAFIQAQFANRSWTNWNGMNLPTSFKLVGYGPTFTSRTIANLDVSYTITGRVEQIRPTHPFDPVPKLATRTLITDSRMMQGNRPTAYVTTNRWDGSDAIR